MDTALAVASKRDARRYADRPLPGPVVTRILDAGRLAGSARNRQPWRFLVPEGPALRRAVAGTVFAPATVAGAALAVVVVVTPGGGLVDLDAGRAAQNMMLVAWGEGVVSCPNGVADRARLHELLHLNGEERAAIVLSFGYPERPRDPARRSVASWSAAADRLPLAQVVRRLPDDAPAGRTEPAGG